MPPYKYAYLVILIMLMGGILSVLVLLYISPSDHDGTTNEAQVDFEVKESTEPPISLRLAHSFAVSVSGGRFEVVDGPDHIDYSVVITSSDGREVYLKNSSFDVPWLIRISSGGNTYSMTDNQDIDLPVGKYTMALTATHPIYYYLAQKNRLAVPLQISGLVVVLSVLLLVIALLWTSNARKALRAFRMIAAFSPPTVPPPYYGGGLPVYPAPNYQIQPPPASAYIEDKEPVDYMCAKCGNIIQNPVIQNVITCEKCGEKEYTGLK